MANGKVVLKEMYIALNKEKWSIIEVEKEMIIKKAIERRWIEQRK